MADPLVGFIVKNRNGKFIPMIGHPVDVPSDQSVHVVGHQEAQDTIEKAREFIVNEPSLIGWYLDPVEYVGQQVWLVSTFGANSKGTT